MNIAFVNSTRRWGGVKTWYLQFAERLAKRGNHVFVYGRQPEFIDAARKRGGHGEQVSFGADLNPSAIRFFYNEFKKHDIDVVITNIGYCDGWSCRAAAENSSRTKDRSAGGYSISVEDPVAAYMDTSSFFMPMPLHRRRLHQESPIHKS